MSPTDDRVDFLARLQPVQKKVLQRWNLFSNGWSIWALPGCFMEVFSRNYVVHSVSTDMMNWWNMWKHSTPEALEFTQVKRNNQFHGLTRGSFTCSLPNSRCMSQQSLQCQEVYVSLQVQWGRFEGFEGIHLSGRTAVWRNRWLIFPKWIKYDQIIYTLQPGTLHGLH